MLVMVVVCASAGQVAAHGDAHSCMEIKEPRCRHVGLRAPPTCLCEQVLVQAAAVQVVTQPLQVIRPTHTWQSV